MMDTYVLIVMLVAGELIVCCREVYVIVLIALF